MSYKTFSPLSLLVLGSLVFAPKSNAAIVTLADGNSTAQVNTTSQAGMFNWEIAGQNQLNQQWFWYRVGSGLQNSIDSGATVTHSQPAADRLDAKYNYGTFSIDVHYDLNSGGINTASISEIVSITNLTGSSLSIDIFQYSDFNLGGSALGDSILIDNSQAYQDKGGLFIGEGIIDPLSLNYEANTTGGTGSTLYKLNNTPSLSLNNVDNASGDVTWAFQWHFEIDGNGFQEILKGKNLAITLVPEPSTLSLMSIAFGSIAVLRRRSSI